MKIGILTQPLHTNYGGLLQAYALQTVLKRMGHEPWVVRREGKGHRRDRFTDLLNRIKYLIKWLLGRKSSLPVNAQEYAIVSKNTRQFVDNYITPFTPRLYTSSSLKKYTESNGFDAFVVGSDQVWRPCYSPCITNYFLDFAQDRQVKRIAYAASFGVDEWEFSGQDGNRCAALAPQFDGISVREASGVRLCKEHFGIDALHVLDPTLLLDKEDYEALVQAEQEPECSGNLFCYILDQTSEKTKAIESVVTRLHLTPFTSMPKLNAVHKNMQKNPDDCVFPPVTRWIRSFIDAKMVVTDSFHGCVFSIIFNKPFWVIGNKERGMARFESLLGLFGLEQRLISPDKLSTTDFSAPIDWTSVNGRKQAMRKQSLDFLQKHLNNEQ